MKRKPSSSPLVTIEQAVPAFRRAPLRWCARAVERLLALDVINRIHADTLAETDSRAFMRSVLEGFGVSYDVRADELLRIPAEGPVIVVSNHPFGGLDAIILTTVLAGVRPDARVLANHLLERIPQVRPLILPVDPFGGPGASRRNVQYMQRALAHLQSGGLLGIFPSGTVSHFHWSRFGVEDPEWSRHLHRLVQRSGATVVPAYFPGRNSLGFQIAGVLHPLLRTALIPREAARLRGRTLRLVIGRPIPAKKLGRFDDATRFTEFLRANTYVLAGAGTPPARVREAAQEPLASPEDPATLAAEVAALPEGDVVIREGNFLVLVVRAGRDPALLREVGRLREETFRGVGEGTGRDRDLDEFDEHYLHLVLWDVGARRVAGGYRLARVDEVLASHGRAGLYTTSLFRFRPGFLRRLGPALELGRSWVHADYQRKHNSLALLWRGISTLIVRQPECCLVLGPVSISRDYQPLSRGLIVSFLKHTRLDRRLAAFVRPSRPYRMRGLLAQIARNVGGAVQNIDDVSLLVSEIEADGKGVPLLFRHYLRFHSIVLNFNVDPAFADVVDGLLLTDLRRTDAQLLRRFMGAEGYEKFAAHHSLGATSAGTRGGNTVTSAPAR